MTPATRLRCAESHVAAIRRMVEEDAPCSAVLLQIRAVRGSLQAVARLLMEAEVQRTLHDRGVTEAAELVAALGEVMVRDTQEGARSRNMITHPSTVSRPA